MAGRDKMMVELLLLFFLIMILYLFSPDISSFFYRLQNNFDFPPIKAFFWFLYIVSKMFGNWIFSLFAYLITGGILYLVSSRKY